MEDNDFLENGVLDFGVFRTSPQSHLADFQVLSSQVTCRRELVNGRAQLYFGRLSLLGHSCSARLHFSLQENLWLISIGILLQDEVVTSWDNYDENKEKLRHSQSVDLVRRLLGGGRAQKLSWGLVDIGTPHSQSGVAISVRYGH